jgi:hypothetical protein
MSRRAWAVALAALMFSGCFARRTTPPRERGPNVAPRPEPNGTPLTTSPSDLLKPEGARLIQRALAQREYLPEAHATGRLDRATVDALKRFQKDSALPRTGFPDRETVKKLGLDPGDVFRAATSEATFPDAADLHVAD